MLRLSELAKMNKTARGAALRTMLASANGVPAHVQEEIASYEKRYCMSSSTMLAKMNRGEIADTADTARWCVLLRSRGDGK